MSRKPKEYAEREIKSFDIQNGKTVRVFLRSIGHTVFAFVRADGVPGHVKMIRQDEKHWLVLEDTLDRTVLFVGAVPHTLQLDIEKSYQGYLLDDIIAGDT